MNKIINISEFCPQFSTDFVVIKCKNFNCCDAYKKGKCILASNELIAYECVYGEKTIKSKIFAEKVLEKQPNLFNKLKKVDETCYIGDYVFFYQANGIRFYNKSAYLDIKNNFNGNSYLIEKQNFSTTFLKNFEVNSYVKNEFYDCPYATTEVSDKNKRITEMFKRLFCDIKRNLPEVYKKFLDEQGNKN